jgi:hypothetical protein
MSRRVAGSARKADDCRRFNGKRPLVGAKTSPSLNPIDRQKDFFLAVEEADLNIRRISPEISHGHLSNSKLVSVGPHYAINKYVVSVCVSLIGHLDFPLSHPHPLLSFRDVSHNSLFVRRRDGGVTALPGAHIPRQDR